MWSTYALQVHISVPSSVLVCSILCQDKKVHMDMGVLSYILLPRQHIVYTLLPMDMIWTAACGDSVYASTNGHQLRLKYQSRPACTINVEALNRHTLVFVTQHTYKHLLPYLGFWGVTLCHRIPAEAECAICASHQHCMPAQCFGAVYCVYHMEAHAVETYHIPEIP